MFLLWRRFTKLLRLPLFINEMIIFTPCDPRLKRCNFIVTYYVRQTVTSRLQILDTVSFYSGLETLMLGGTNASMSVVTWRSGEYVLPLIWHVQIKVTTKVLDIRLFLLCYLKLFCVVEDNFINLPPPPTRVIITIFLLPFRKLK
jgi:hypothetical protein